MNNFDEKNLFYLRLVFQRNSIERRGVVCTDESRKIGNVHCPVDEVFHAKAFIVNCDVIFIIHIEWSVRKKVELRKKVNILSGIGSRKGCLNHWLFNGFLTGGPRRVLGKAWSKYGSWAKSGPLRPHGEIFCTLSRCTFNVWAYRPHMKAPNKFEYCAQTKKIHTSDLGAYGCHKSEEP